MSTNRRKPSESRKKGEVIILARTKGVRGKGDLIERALQVPQLAASFAAFTDAISEIVEATSFKLQQYSLDEIQVSVEISAEGEIKLLGSGVSTSASGGLTLTFKRAGTS